MWMDVVDSNGTPFALRRESIIYTGLTEEADGRGRQERGSSPQAEGQVQPGPQAHVARHRTRPTPRDGPRREGRLASETRCGSKRDGLSHTGLCDSQPYTRHNVGFVQALGKAVGEIESVYGTKARLTSSSRPVAHLCVSRRSSNARPRDVNGCTSIWMRRLM